MLLESAVTLYPSRSRIVEAISTIDLSSSTKRMCSLPLGKGGVSSCTVLSVSLVAMGSENIIEIVRDPPCQRAYGLHLVDLSELLLENDLGRYVTARDDLIRAPHRS